MDSLADRFSEHGVGSIFVYTHEAHPVENYPHLTSMKQKFRHAEALRDVLGVRRPILLDALDGACHRAYGSMPNMRWILPHRASPSTSLTGPMQEASRTRSSTSWMSWSVGGQAFACPRSGLSDSTTGARIGQRPTKRWSPTARSPSGSSERLSVSAP